LQEKWKIIANIISSRDVARDWKDVRGAYQRWKMQAKKNYFAQKDLKDHYVLLVVIHAIQNLLH